MDPSATTERYSDRPLTPGDASFVVALHVAPHARRHVIPPTRERVIETIDEPGYERRIIVDAEGTPVGFWALLSHGDGWLVELVRLITLAPGRGIGRWALRRMIARAFDDLGAHRLYLEVTADNAPARALYESEGFVLEGTFRHGFRDATGAFRDLCAYGMLASERRSSNVRL